MVGLNDAASRRELGPRPEIRIRRRRAAGDVAIWDETSTCDRAPAADA